MPSETQVCVTLSDYVIEPVEGARQSWRDRLGENPAQVRMAGNELREDFLFANGVVVLKKH